MEISKLKNLSISNLILLILNNNYQDIIRKCAEVELRKRIKHLGIEYNDLLHLDDKVINERGLDIDNYLLSPRVNLQQLMETYFKYCYNKNYEENGLLFSEKHLCNDSNFGIPFFSKVCQKEIDRFYKSLGRTYDHSHSWLDAKNVLSERKNRINEHKKSILRDEPIEILVYNDAINQLDDAITLEPYFNLSDEEKYKYLSTKLGQLKLSIADILDDTILDPDIIQYLYALHFIRKDSNKLRYQKHLIMNQIRHGYVVDYNSDEIKKVLK